MKLKANLSLSVDNGKTDVYKSYENTEFLDKEKKGSYAQSTSNDFSYDINVILSYFKSLKKHFINLGFVYNLQEKQYDTELLARGIAKERIRYYGFAFRGKKVLIGN